MVVHRHWVVLLRSLVVPLVVLAVAGIVDLLGLRAQGGGGAARDYLIIGILVLVAAFGVWLLVAWLIWQAATFTLTDQRVLMKTGMLTRQTKVIALDRVTDVTTKQSVLGRLLNYGRVEVDAAGTAGAEIIDYIPDPTEFRDQIFTQAAAYRRELAAIRGGVRRAAADDGTA